MHSAFPTVDWTKWPISHLNGASAGVTQLLAAPGPALSHYITSVKITGGTADKGINILRRSCLKFDAASEDVTVSDNAALEPAAGDFTLEFWIKTAVGTVSAVDIIHKDDGADDGYFVEIDANGLLKFTMGDGTNTATISSLETVNNGIWHHVVVSCDISEDDGLLLYVDAQARATAVDPTDVSGVTGGATDFTLNGTAAKTFYLSTVGLYKAKALTAAEVASRYQGATVENLHHIGEGVGAKFAGTETSLSFALNLDEGIGATNYDMVGANNGTISNATWEDKDGVSPKGDSLGVLQIIDGNVQMDFSYGPIKIGRNLPVNILETDGAFTLHLTGFTSSL